MAMETPQIRREHLRRPVSQLWTIISGTDALALRYSAGIRRSRRAVPAAGQDAIRTDPTTKTEA